MVSFDACTSAAPAFGPAAAVVPASEVWLHAASWSSAGSPGWVTTTPEDPSCGQSPLDSLQSISSRRRAVDIDN